jgi:hypothetical protein
MLLCLEGVCCNTVAAAATACETATLMCLGDVCCNIVAAAATVVSAASAA